MVDGGCLEAGVDHALLAGGVAGGVAVVVPVGLVDELFEGVGVTVLEEVAGFLPAEDVVGGHAPGCAFVFTIAHEVFEEEW